MNPQRDIGSEVVVAIAVVAVLAFALVFGILLTLSSNTNTVAPAPTTIVAVVETAIPTFTHTVESAASNTVTITQTAAVTPVVPSATFSEDATSTTVELPATIFTPTVDLLVTTLRPTETETATLLATLSVTITPFPTFTVTPTHSLSASATSTKVLTSTPTLTATSTRTPTLTATATRTATRIATRTATRTATATSTQTPTNTATFTPVPTETSGIIPTPSFTPTVTGTVTLESCVPPANWTTYVVRSGNTLFSIARSVGSNVRDLSEVNCIVNPDRIITGDVLFVPQLPVEPVRTGILATAAPGSNPPRTTYGVLGCSDGRTAAITNLAAGQRLSNAITLRGTAAIEDFLYYKVEVRPDFATEYNFYFRADTPVERGDLGALDPAVFGAGLHWVRLVVVKQDSSVPQTAVCVIPVQFE